MRSWHPLYPLRDAVLRMRNWWFNRFWGMDIHPTAKISLQAKLDKTYPPGVHIGEYSVVTFGAAILTHDMVRRLRTDTVIGRNCFIGAHSIIMPGVTIGDNSIVAAGAVVTRDVPPATIVAGNPAKIVREGIRTQRYGMLEEYAGQRNERFFYEAPAPGGKDAD